MSPNPQTCAGSPTKKIHIADDLYRILAEKVRIEAEMAESDFERIVVEEERDGYTHIVEVAASLSFDFDWSPCGRPLIFLRQITPCWVKCETYDRWGDQFDNDFTIRKLTTLFTS